MDYVKKMKNGWDEVQFAVEAYDWKRSSFPDAQKAALRIIDLYDFKKKQKLHRSIVLNELDSVGAIHKFCSNLAWSGAKIKFKKEIAA